jgi:hypothetical protein
MMEPNTSQQSNTYHILVKETLNHTFADWYGDLTIMPQQNGETLLIGTFTDQPALRGFLEQLWNLNITVINIERIKNES